MEQRASSAEDRARVAEELSAKYPERFGDFGVSGLRVSEVRVTLCLTGLLGFNGEIMVAGNSLCNGEAD